MMAILRSLLVLSIIVLIGIEGSPNTGSGIQPEPLVNSTTSQHTSPSTPATNSTITELPSSTPKPPTSSKPTTSSEKPTTSSEKPTTSSEKPTTSSEKPTTSSEKPTTSSEKPTTSSKKPTTSSEKPTSPSTPKPTPSPTPSPKPTPTPDPNTGNWVVNFTNSNHSCLIFDAALQIEVLSQNSSQKIDVPLTANFSGKCDNTTDSFSLAWENYTLHFGFNKNNTKFELENLNAILPSGNGSVVLVHKKPEFGTPVGNSYKCAKVQTLNLTDSDNKTAAYLHLSHVQLQAFTNVTGHKFDAAIDCESSPITSDIVPIVVGSVLAALVIMIMVAYLVARRRCQARGYLSINNEGDE